MEAKGEFGPFMQVAIGEARQSLREGNRGFGAVILKDNTILAQAHDREETDQDPTSHAELNAIRMACSRAGKDLSGTVLLSTHEPCSMCVGAILWARIPHVVYGYGIADEAHQGRDRDELSAVELFPKGRENLLVEKGPLEKECSVLYNRAVRRELNRLRGATDGQLRGYDRMLATRRIEWFVEEGRNLIPDKGDATEQGYRLLLKKLGTTEAEAPIVHRGRGRIVFHSKNFCPTLEACIILGLDTRRICRLYNEGATDRLIRQIDPGLRFNRNYGNIRPHSEYCEERIEYEQ
jgi:tRNA(adenine34) deaminase